MKERIQEIINESIAAKQATLQKVEDIEKAVQIVINCYKAGRRLYSCGNGGSACDAMHLAEELVARFSMERPGLPAQAFGDIGTTTCWGNDYSFEGIFERQVSAYGKEGDVLVAISTSGNSPNILKAAEAARKLGMKVIGLAGKDGGKLKQLCDICIVIPSSNTARIQECHIMIIHTICELVEKEMFGEKK